MPPSIAALTPTVCDLMGIPYPDICEAAPLKQVLAAGRDALGPRRVEKALLFAGDAAGVTAQALVPAWDDFVTARAPLRVRCLAEMPPVTPVCFASMMTGAPPAAHGIREYAKPVLACDTLFDALVRAGKRAAIVAAENCSMDRIFRDRPITYLSCRSDAEVEGRSLDLLGDDMDLIVSYHGEYDAMLHATDWDHPDAVAVLHQMLERFATLADAADKAWAGRDRLLVFCPDHGAHSNAADGCGTHGDDIPADREVDHFYAIRSGQ